MSVFKGNQLIVGNGMPGRDGSDGVGIMVTSTRNELHNNYDANGAATNPNTWNTAIGSFNSVEGYQNGANGQALHVEGYQNNAIGGEGSHTEGYENNVTFNEGGHIEGQYNYATISHGGHVEGWENGDLFTNTPVDLSDQGQHLEGAAHKTFVSDLSAGGHQGGYGITSNTPMLGMPPQRSGYETTLIEAIGLKTTGNGEFARVTRNDGSMAINGDMSFTAVDSNGDDIGRYTLGEIVQALINAGILPAPNV